MIGCRLISPPIGHVGWKHLLNQYITYFYHIGVYSIYSHLIVDIPMGSYPNIDFQGPVEGKPKTHQDTLLNSTQLLPNMIQRWASGWFHCLLLCLTNGLSFPLTSDLNLPLCSPPGTFVQVLLSQQGYKHQKLLDKGCVCLGGQT